MFKAHGKRYKLNLLPATFSRVILDLQYSTDSFTEKNVFVVCQLWFMNPSHCSEVFYQGIYEKISITFKSEDFSYLSTALKLVKSELNFSDLPSP